MSVGGLAIAFEEEIAETDVRNILAQYDLHLPYKLRFDVSYFLPRFYTIISKHKFKDIKEALKRENIYISNRIFKLKNDEIVVAIEGDEYGGIINLKLKRFGLQLKRLLWVYVDYQGKTISSNDAICLKEKLEKCENIIYVFIDYCYGI